MCGCWDRHMGQQITSMRPQGDRAHAPHPDVTIVTTTCSLSGPWVSPIRAEKTDQSFFSSSFWTYFCYTEASHRLNSSSVPPPHPQFKIRFANPPPRRSQCLSLSALGVRPPHCQRDSVMANSPQKAWMASLSKADSETINVAALTERSHSEMRLGSLPNRGRELWTVSHMKGFVSASKSSYAHQIRSGTMIWRWLLAHGSHCRECPGLLFK